MIMETKLKQQMFLEFLDSDSPWLTILTLEQMPHEIL